MISLQSSVSTEAKWFVDFKLRINYAAYWYVSDSIASYGNHQYQ